MRLFRFSALRYPPMRAMLLSWLLVSLAGCETTYNKNVTGTRGGLLPGMTLPEPFKTPDTSAAKPDSTNETLPDGRILHTETLGQVVTMKAWLSAQGMPQQVIYYEAGMIPSAEEDYGANGQLLKVTRWYPGTNQIYWQEDYGADHKPLSKTSYWPNGVRQIFSEYGVTTPAGPVNRIQTWYQNGRPKSLVQKILVGATPMLQGRQTNWDENGAVVFDMDYDHDVIVHDYLAGKSRSPW